MPLMRPVRTVLSGIGLLAAVALAYGADPPPQGQRIVITGHSFHMPVVTPLEQVAAAAGITGHRVVGKQGIGGSSVTQHWDRPEATNLAKKALRAGGVDVLTVAPNLLMPDPAIDRFTDLLLEHNPGGRVLVQASWVPLDGRPRNGGFQNADRDRTDLAELRKAGAPWLEKVRAQVREINDGHAAKRHRPVAFVVPVGEAVLRLRERVARGQVPGIARQADLFRDPLGHGLPPVAVLNAYCHFAVIYGRSPVGLPVPAALEAAGLGDDTAAVNRILQEVAWAAVTDEPLSGVQPPEAKQR